VHLVGSCYTDFIDSTDSRIAIHYSVPFQTANSHQT